MKSTSKVTFFPVLAMLAATIISTSCGRPDDKGVVVGNSSDLSGFPSMDKRWPSSTINVCWEASAHPWIIERSWVREKIRAEYENTTHMRFVGWDACPDPSWPTPYRFDGISIAIRNDGPGAHTDGLGTALRNNRKGLNLNFRFNDVPGFEGCVGDEKTCIENIAAHEFGHAIGMAHEQNRGDTPGFCDQRQGSNGTHNVGMWDLDSIMNYCNPVWNAGGKLSPKDIDTIQVMYPDSSWPIFANVKIDIRYNQLDRERGPLGHEVHGTRPTPDGYGYFRGFQNGYIYVTPGRGAFEIYGAIGSRWAQLGWERFGYPVTGEMTTPDGIGRYNHLEDGKSIYWTPATGAHEVYGAIRFKWAEMGWENSYLGYPVSGELGTPDGKGRMSHFQNGSIYWTPELGAVPVHKRIMEHWGTLNWENGPLGYPTEATVKVSDNFMFQRFQGGMVYYNSSRGHWDVRN